MESENLLNQSGIIITIVLIAIPALVAIIVLIVKSSTLAKNLKKKRDLEAFNKHLETMSRQELEELEERQRKLGYKLEHTELSGTHPVDDKRGLINRIARVENYRFIETKKRSIPRPDVDPDLRKLVLWYIVCSAVYLVIGTTVGEYLGIKFVAPDVDHFSWLSFGRLRPVHTNMVFWGWCSLSMVGLSYYVVPRVSNIKIYSIKLGYWTLALMNAAVIFGTISLMAGVNNSGGEYREYIWPIMLLFGIGIVVSLINFIRTIARRTTKEIYVSNWYIISAMMFVIVISLVAYLPFWQDGLGNTISQGYYMHQGVGMWFMFLVLGLVYYYLPQQLNKPIYSYSLGILAFWTQILFYTLIGSHHFIFSSIPWWLQTVAIIGSVGMIIPVVAGTTNFLMTFKGSWHKLSTSYTLPFYLIGIIFYFTGSLQGTAEAFRYTNQIWHFTDFTVAHSHLTMYGIITFFLWAFTYTIVPRLTGKEPPQLTVGAHFWLALIGLLFYTVPLMWGSTLRGVEWMEGTPFIETVKMMAPYWLWRAIGGSLMWVSHVIFAYNIYTMIWKKPGIVIPETPAEILEARANLTRNNSSNSNA